MVASAQSTSAPSRQIFAVGPLACAIETPPESLGILMEGRRGAPASRHGASRRRKACGDGGYAIRAAVVGSEGVSIAHEHATGDDDERGPRARERGDERVIGGARPGAAPPRRARRQVPPPSSL